MTVLEFGDALIDVGVDRGPAFFGGGFDLGILAELGKHVGWDGHDERSWEGAGRTEGCGSGGRLVAGGGVGRVLHRGAVVRGSGVGGVDAALLERGLEGFAELLKSLNFSPSRAVTLSVNLL